MRSPQFRSIGKELRHSLRIAQVAPLYESAPPTLYAGTERIGAYLTQELVRRSHEVALFASGDSMANANIPATYPAALRAASIAHMGASLLVPALSEVFRPFRSLKHYRLPRGLLELSIRTVGSNPDRHHAPRAARYQRTIRGLPLLFRRSGYIHRQGATPSPAGTELGQHLRLTLSPLIALTH
jgi:hypothetical protein